MRVSLRSKVLGEERPLLVHAPASYGTNPQARYPVLYLLDGDAHFHHVTGVVQFLAANGRIPEMLVVAVPNTRDRTHDLTPAAATGARRDGRLLTEQFPTAGGAERFRKFLTEELVPSVDAQYRTRPYRVLVGHSFGGLFAVDTLVRAPAAFNAYVAVSPTLGWNDGELVRALPEAFAKAGAAQRGLYFSMGAEGDEMLGPVRTLARTLEARKPAALAWRYAELPDDDHGSTPHRTVYDGLEFLFADWRPPAALLREGEVAQLEAHYAALSARMGYEVRPPEAQVNLLGYRHLQARRVPQALAAFERNAALYPDSANVHDSLGEALEAAGRLREALVRYERAVTLGRGRKDPNLPAYEAHAKAARGRVAEATAP
jgi:uncharacterized protein